MGKLRDLNVEYIFDVGMHVLLKIILPPLHGAILKIFHL